MIDQKIKIFNTESENKNIAEKYKLRREYLPTLIHVNEKIKLIEPMESKEY